MPVPSSNGDTTPKDHQEQLEQINSRLEFALNNMLRGLSMFDANQRLIVCNKIYRDIYGLPEHLTRPGTLFADIVRYHVKKETGRDDPQELENQRKWIAGHVAELARGKSFSHIQQLSCGRIIRVSNQPVSDGGWVDLQEDITEERRREAEIARLSRHDTLTDLPNRAFLQERLEQALKSARKGEHVVLMCLNLDRFSAVNDTLGHSAGDQLLKAVAERLRSCIRDRDTAARIGGDEFVLVQFSTDPAHEGAAQAMRTIEALRAPYDIDGYRVEINVSIGIATSPNDGSDPDSLLKHASLALAGAKEDGPGTYCFFEPEMNSQMQARRELERDLSVAVSNGELELAYQAQVNLERNEVSGFEALLRWRHPKRGMVSPGEFIPLAEETGHIIAIGQWALRQTCFDAATWPDHIKVAVNLSPVQFKSRELIETVSGALDAAGLPARRLELEITETLLMQDTDANLDTLYKLRALGVRIALDDFGTGYSSLSYLQTFPFDKIKIDRSFVQGISDTPARSLPIVGAVAQLGRAFGMSITAEGVETAEQLERVRSKGCTEVQGYYFSRPKSLSQVREQYFPQSGIGASAA